MIKKIKKNQDQAKDRRTGKFTVTNSSPIIRWNNPDPLRGFANWFKDLQPHTLHSNHSYQRIALTRVQIETLKEVLAVDDQGKLKHSMSLLVWPRRHGKSTLCALVVLWLFCSRKNHTTQLLGTQADHSRKVQLGLLKKIVLNSPRLKKLIGEENIYADSIQYPKRSNVIQTATTSLSGAFGDRYNILWVSDLHAHENLEPYAAMQSSMLDADDSICLIDSNVDATDGHVHELERASEDDQGIFCSHVQYRDLTHYLSESGAPPWINRAKAKRLQSTLLPAQFDRDALGKRGDSTCQLFGSEIISLCKSDYKIPVTDLKSLTHGRAYKIGGGLDRARSLFQGKDSDATVWTVILKTASPQHGEPEFFILESVVFPVNTSRLIKKAILNSHQKYKLDACTLENHEVVDLTGFLSDQKIPYELLSPHDSNQNMAFPELFRIAREGRLHFPADLDGLTKEMGTFVYSLKSNGKYSFGHSSTKFHDDRIFSLCWAVHSLRSSVMAAYTLGSFACRNKSPNRHFCFLMDGELVLHCSAACPAYMQVEAMFREYKSLLMDSELTIAEFFSIKCRRDGARLYQAA